MLKHMKFPFLVSSTRFVLTHGTHFMRRNRIFVMEIRDLNTGGGRFGFILFQYIQITYEYEETIVANEIMLLYPPLSPELGQCI